MVNKVNGNPRDKRRKDIHDRLGSNRFAAVNEVRPKKLMPSLKLIEKKHHGKTLQINHDRVFRLYSCLLKGLCKVGSQNVIDSLKGQKIVAIKNL